jgi:hypothetical protein
VCSEVEMALLEMVDASDEGNPASTEEEVGMLRCADVVSDPATLPPPPLRAAIPSSCDVGRTTSELVNALLDAEIIVLDRVDEIVEAVCRTLVIDCRTPEDVEMPCCCSTRPPPSANASTPWNAEAVPALVVELVVVIAALLNTDEVIDTEACISSTASPPCFTACVGCTKRFEVLATLPVPPPVAIKAAAPLKLDVSAEGLLVAFPPPCPTIPAGSNAPIAPELAVVVGVGRVSLVEVG